MRPNVVCAARLYPTPLGIVTRISPKVVRTESGRELTFSYELVILFGEVQSPLELKVGEQVGYDLGWTSSGLRVTKIKTYPKFVN